MRSSSVRRELLGALVSREMKARYKGSALGLLWSLLTPLFMAGIYAFFFRLISGRAANTSSIIVGVFAWQFTSNSVQQGLGCISNNSNLVKKVAFPRIILPLSTTLAAGIDYAISLVVQIGLVGILLWKGGEMFSLRILWLPLIVFLHGWVNMGFATLLGAMNVYYRDTQHFVGVGLSALFFMSPAMYDLKFVSDLAREHNPLMMNLYALNPFAGIFTAYRCAFLPGEVFPTNPWLIAGMVWPFFFTLLAVIIFRKAQRNFADYI